MTSVAPPSRPVPILCPRCRMEVATVTDGPGVFIVEMGELTERLEGGDNSARCPGCDARIYWRVLRSAA